jgi:diaminopropionate ammonia-lyase
VTRVNRNRFCQERIGPDLLRPAPDNVLDFHRSLVGYAPTPLVRLPALATELGVKDIWLKDESKRFGLNAFKVLGASYAIHRFVETHLPAGLVTFATATDGNHGRAVAWTARRLGHAAVVFVPKHTVKARMDAIANEGARVAIVDGTYDDAVRAAAGEAAAHGWQVISDTGYAGYMQIPDWIMEGYTTLFEEAIEQVGAAGGRPPDVVFLQAGVGGFACAGVRFFRRRDDATRPRLIVVEPTDADCLFESISSPDGSIREGKGGQRSIMAGLNCGTPSIAAWPVLRAGVDLFMAIDDSSAEDAMQRLDRAGVISGESGAAGLAGLVALAGEHDVRVAMGIGADATVLVVSTEGDTDPVNWRRVTQSSPWRAMEGHGEDDTHQ